MFPWEYVDRVWSTKSEGVGLIVRAISFQDFQPMWSWSTNVTYRQTDGHHAIAIPHYALVHRAVKSLLWGTTGSLTWSKYRKRGQLTKARVYESVGVWQNGHVLK